MERYKMVGLSQQVYDVRSQIEILKEALLHVHELTELVRDGFEVTLDDLSNQLAGIEEGLIPPPCDMAVSPQSGVNVIHLRKVA